jgi:hypothetical protein
MHQKSKGLWDKGPGEGEQGPTICWMMKLLCMPLCGLWRLPHFPSRVPDHF